MKELLAWKSDNPDDCGQKFSVASIPHLPKVNKESKTKTLVCHDMMGGYISDRFVQGVNGQAATGYNMRYWSNVDIFVYFSHHFVTIPPVGWINAAHKNGVTILGTFITEGEDGFLRCKYMLSSTVIWKATADKLIEVATYYGFDGWLINIENEINTEKVSDLIEFIGYLTAGMHEVDKNSLVIWYDSIVRNGTLNWQNELNHKNRAFYEACDGIFLNYLWKEENLERTRQQAHILNQVYVGIDVFGRGVYGGGGYNSAAALAKIRKFGLSAAIFAPGWVYEELGHEHFGQNHHHFWDLLKHLCESRDLDGKRGIATRFNPGCGINGENKSAEFTKKSKTWYHLNSQDTLPSCLLNNNFSLIETFSGFSLTVSPLVNKQDQSSTLVIFSTELYSEDNQIVVTTDEASKKSTFVMTTSLGPCVLKHQFADYGFAVKTITQNNMVHMCVSNETSFVVNAISVQQTESYQAISLLQMIPGSLPPQSDVIATVVLCSEVEWLKSQSSRKNFLFSCTLVFNNIPEGTCSTEVSYLLGNRQNAQPSSCMLSSLGIASVSRYRVHQLEVPNPQYGGPDCFIVFHASHLNALGQLVGKGQLKLTYCENS
ncbi:unnamed protein product [Clavelina lepadiformis]|uniref:Cytosolic endo-beta-N-acetylglucosaminidase TIM barrel domain-containing protein n=1 Tax=Clavelina lepadiformis TaxID=159417 RepID=A0ABP0GGC7_CLALP